MVRINVSLLALQVLVLIHGLFDCHWCDIILTNSAEEISQSVSDYKTEKRERERSDIAFIR